MAEAKTTSNPRAARRTATTTTKAATAKAEAPKTATKTTASERVAATSTEDSAKRVIHLAHVGDTKSFSKWQPSEDEDGVTGTFYAPLGAETVRVLVVMGDAKE